VIPETLNGIPTDAGDSGRDSYKRHRFPVCLARLSNNDIIPPSLMLCILIRIGGKRADILAPPVMFDMVMLGRKQSLRNSDIVMMRRAHAAVESLLSAQWPSLYCKERIRRRVGRRRLVALIAGLSRHSATSFSVGKRSKALDSECK
jgi:hypothetical protein